MIVFAAIVPHPLFSIPGIGNEEDFKRLEKTMSSFDELRKVLEEANPDTIVVISPHAVMEPYAFVINSAKDLEGNFEKQGLDLELSFKNDIEIADKLDYVCGNVQNEMPAHLHPNFLDHGALVPLYHLTKNIKPMVVHLSFSLMNYERHFRYGEILGSIIGGHSSKRVAIIASGDLSHRIYPDSPAGYSPSAKDFDQNMIYFLGKNDVSSLLGLQEETARQAAECGVRSIIVLLGALHDEKYQFKLLSYESPFGIGHLTARLV